MFPLTFSALFLLVLVLIIESSQDTADYHSTGKLVEKNSRSPFLTCSFDKDWCQFTDTTAYAKHWKDVEFKETASTPAATVPAKNPPTPPTTGDRFLFIDLQNDKPTMSMGEVRSRIIKKSESLTGRYCLKFTMFMASHDMTTFKIVRLSPDLTDLDVRVLFGDNDGKWNLRHVDFQADADFTLALLVEVAAEAKSAGVLAVDDLTLETGYCTPNGEAAQVLTVNDVCDFEEGNCGFQSKPLDDTTPQTQIPWFITSGQKRPSNPIELLEVTPGVDSTYHSTAGHYAFVYFGEKTTTKNMTAAYTSTTVAFSQRYEHCLEFFYRNHRLPNTPEIELILDMLELESNPKEVWRSRVDHGKVWVSVRRNVYTSGSAGQYALHFVANAPAGAHGAVAVDDVAIMQGNCTASFDCKFDVNICAWSRDFSDNSKMSWEVDWSPANGPDHEQKYLFIQGSRSTGHAVGSRAHIYSSDFSGPEFAFQCVTFSYYVSSKGAALLRLHHVANPAKSNPVWEHYGHEAIDPDHLWKLGRAPLLDQNINLVVFEAMILREVDETYVTAIKDVHFMMQPCTWSPPDSKPLPDIPPPENYGDRVCDFDGIGGREDLPCEYTQVNAGPQVKWLLANGRGAVANPAQPPFDHSTLEDDGNYLYFNSPKGSSADSSAKVVSKAFTREKVDDPRCLHFWYFIKGLHRKRDLTVLVEANQNSEAVWSSATESHEMGAWKKAGGKIAGRFMEFRIVFEGKVVDGEEDGGISIDDVAVAERECIQVDCDFEHGSCNWEGNYQNFGGKIADLDWIFANNSTLPALPALGAGGPGYFMQVPLHPSTPLKHVAKLEHESLVESSGLTCLHFDFVSTVDGLATLSIFFRPVGEEDVASIWKSDGSPTVGRWQHGQVVLDRKLNGRQANLHFEVERSMINESVPLDRWHGIGLDNIVHKSVEHADDCLVEPLQAGFNCEFGYSDGYMCGWFERPVDGEIWTIAKPGSELGLNSPTIDHAHSHLGLTGNFVYMKADKENPHTKARFFSPIGGVKSPMPYCIRFFYFANGPQVGTIKFLALYPGQEVTVDIDPVLVVGGRSYGNQWIGVQYQDNDYTRVKRFAMEAEEEVNSAAFVAFDDVTLTHGVCRPAGDCDFNHDWCLYNPNFDMNARWRKSFPSSSGFYASATRERGGKASLHVLRSSLNPPQKRGCFRAKYLLTNSLEYSSLKFWMVQYPRNASADPVKMLLWNLDRSVDPPFVNRFQDASMAIFSDEPFQISIEVEYLFTQFTQSEFMAVDDLFLTTDKSCPHMPKNSNPDTFACDFDDSTAEMCFWRLPTPLPDYRWSRVMARKAASDSGGPNVDHTTMKAEGHYLYAVSEDGDLKTRIHSPFIRDGAPRCLTFYFHVYGQGIRALRVLARSGENANGGDVVIWSRHSPDEGKVWQHAQVDIPNNPAGHQLFFESETDHGFADVALDDISSTPGVCHADDSFCDFERGRCNFDEAIGSSTDEIVQWQRISPAHPSGPTGVMMPANDVTLDLPEGHFLIAFYLDSAKARKVVTKTPPYPTAGDYPKRCFQFYYYIHTNGNPKDTFVVTLINSTGAYSQLRLSGFEPETTHDWRIWNFQVPESTFSVQFETELTSGTSISIDDVALYDGTCVHLLDCEFDSDSSCLWTQATDSDDTTFHWHIVSPSTPGYKIGPQTDHTTEKDVGWLALAVGNEGRYARLLSPAIPPKEIVCITFWYYFSKHKGEDPPCALNVHALNPSTTKSTWLWSYNQEKSEGKWEFGMVSRTITTFEKMVLEADMGHYPGCFVGLDDIFITQEKCQIHPDDALPPASLRTTPKPPPTGRPGATTARGGGVSSTPGPVAEGTQSGIRSHPKDLGGGPIAGIVIGMFTLVVVVCGGAFLVERRRRAGLNADLTSPGYVNFSDAKRKDSAATGIDLGFTDLYIGEA